MSERIRTRFLVVGSGVAGLHTAWRASQHGDVLLLTKRSLFDSATAYAQGGIAAALGAGDSPKLHRQDTLAAGAALCDAAAVQVLVEEGPARVRELQVAGAQFDLDPKGELLLGREAAHSINRIVHAHGDQTGAEVARTLIARVRASDRIRVLERARVLDLIVARGECVGVRASIAGRAVEIIAVLGKYLIPRAAGLPVDVEVASEFQHIQLRPRTLVLGITQSGETADTMISLKKSRTCGVGRLAITNVVGSTVTGLVDGTIYTRCGPEIGVAATKTFTGQLAALFLLAIRLGRARNHLTPDQGRKMLVELTRLPGLVQSVLDKREEIRKIAEEYAGAGCYFFIGRDFLYPIALEGALKMKEIAYIPSEGYAGGELKHGPLALITEKTPVVALATCGRKIQSNIKEVRARGADVIAFATEGDPDIGKVASTVIELPQTRPVYSAVLCTVGVQLLAYYTAAKLGLPIDKPRNLAKCVTVE